MPFNGRHALMNGWVGSHKPGSKMLVKVGGETIFRRRWGCSCLDLLGWYCRNVLFFNTVGGWEIGGWSRQLAKIMFSCKETYLLVWLDMSWSYQGGREHRREDSAEADRALVENPLTHRRTLRTGRKICAFARVLSLSTSQKVLWEGIVMLM